MRAFTGLLRAGVDPAARVSKEWTVRDTAAHIAGSLPVYVRMVRGEPSPVSELDRLGEFNQRLLAVDEHNVYVFADTIDRGMAELLDGVDDREGDPRLMWHGGTPLPLSTLLGLVAGEGYVHGHDVARAAQVGWTIRPEDAVTIFHTAIPLLPAMLDPDRSRDMGGSVELRLRGANDGRWTFVFGRPSGMGVERANGRRADWTVSAAPAAYLLSAYGRLSPMKALLTGQITGWGRRPALGFQFIRAFRKF